VKGAGLKAQDSRFEAKTKDPREFSPSAFHPFGPEPLGLEGLDLSSSTSLVAERLTAEGLLPLTLRVRRCDEG
jgi:hypothetical protein